MYEALLDVLQPFSLLLMATIALAWLGRKSRRVVARRAAIVTGGLLVVSSTSGFGWLALTTLEKQVENTNPDDARAAEAIVVLGGGLIPNKLDRRGAMPTPETVCRTLAAFAQYQQRPRPIVVSGGPGPFAALGVSEASVMRDLLLALGVDPAHVVLEDSSRSTYENARQCRRILEKRGIRHVLITTHASHMPRALACFEAQGFQATPAPCRFRTREIRQPLQYFVPTPRGAAQTAIAAHEWLGIIWYRLSGKI